MKMNQIKTHVRYWAMHAMKGCLLLFLLLFTACDNRNIHQVVREMAAAPVDTVGWPSKTMRTNPFSAVDIDCFADVTFHQMPSSRESYVELKAASKVLENVDVKVEEGYLRITVDRRYRMPEKAVVVVNIYAPYVNRFILDGGKCLRLGQIEMTSPLELMVDGNVGTMISDSIVAHEISLWLDGNGSFDLKGIRTGNVRAKLNGEGRMFLAGMCTTTKLAIKGNGKIDIAGLASDSIASEDVVGRGVIVKRK